MISAPILPYENTIWVDIELGATYLLVRESDRLTNCLAEFVKEDFAVFFGVVEAAIPIDSPD